MSVAASNPTRPLECEKEKHGFWLTGVTDMLSAEC